MRLGPIEIDSPFILAPMAGITHAPFRRLMRRMGSALVVSELASAVGITHKSRNTDQILAFHSEERPVGLQIFGEDAPSLVAAAQDIERRGADFVDLNLGCPVPKIVKKGGGAAMCRNPAELGRTLNAMVRSVRIPVTIKIRTGWDADTRNAHEVIRVATEAGVAWAAVHGRTRAQGYSGLADWEFIGELKSRATIPILGNGDVTTAVQALERLKTYGVDGVLIGRGALRNPFIFEQAQALWRGVVPRPDPGPTDYLELIQVQRQMFEDFFKPMLAGLQVKKFLSWYSSGYSGCHEFRRRIFQSENFQEVWQDAFSFFQANAQERSRDLTFLSQPFLMGGHG